MNDPKHPLWKILVVVVVLGFLTVWMALTHQRFDFGEVKDLGIVAGTLLTALFTILGWRRE